mgnify:CR=1 FL=1
MSAEDEDSQKKAHSALVDFFVMFKRFRGTSLALVAVSVLMVISIITIINEEGYRTSVCLDMQTGKIIENCQTVFVSEVPGPDDGLTIFADYIPVVHVVMLATGISLVFIIGWELLWFLTKRKTHRELLQIHSSFIHRSYVTMFEFVRPEGETKVDKLFNHLSLVFPEVEKFKERLDKKQKKFSEREESLLYPKTETTDTYDFITATGTFLLIIFKTTVKWEDVEKMIKVNNRDQNVEKLFGSDIMRIIYLADKYDPFFETDDFISKMKETKRKFKLDLIKEDNLGYSTIWIDR